MRKFTGTMVIVPLLFILFSCKTTPKYWEVCSDLNGIRTFYSYCEEGTKMPTYSMLWYRTDNYPDMVYMGDRLPAGGLKDKPEGSIGRPDAN